MGKVIPPPFVYIKTESSVLKFLHSEDCIGKVRKVSEMLNFCLGSWLKFETKFSDLTKKTKKYEILFPDSFYTKKFIHLCWSLGGTCTLLKATWMLGYNTGRVTSLSFPMSKCYLTRMWIGISCVNTTKFSFLSVLFSLSHGLFSLLSICL